MAASAALVGAFSCQPAFAFSISASSVRPNARIELPTMLVAMYPGITSATRTCGAFVRRSSISDSVNPLTANLAVL